MTKILIVCDDGSHAEPVELIQFRRPPGPGSTQFFFMLNENVSPDVPQRLMGNVPIVDGVRRRKLDRRVRQGQIRARYRLVCSECRAALVVRADRLVPIMEQASVAGVSVVSISGLRGILSLGEASR